MKDKPELRVALLTSDLGSCQSLAAAFRLYRIFPFFYQTLADLWPLLKASEIDLLVVEITKLQEGQLILSDHPLLQAQNIPIAIYFKPEHQGLLSLAHNLTTIGHINSSVSLAHQIKGLVYFLQQLTEAKGQRDSLQKELHQRDRLLESAKKSEELSKENLLKMIQVAEVIQKFQKKRAIGKDNFLELLSSFFESWTLVEKFSFVTVNSSGKKLFSPRFVQFKYCPLNAMHLKDSLNEGIDPLNREVFLAQAYQSLGIDVIVLDIQASHQYPDVMVFLQVKEEQLKKTEDSYHWLVLENILSNLYKSALLQEQQQQQHVETQLSPLRALSALDNMVQPELDQGLRAVMIDASSLEHWLLRSGFGFQWSDFDRDFIGELLLQFKGNIQWCYMGPYQWIFFLPPILFDINYDQLQRWVRDFDYASYVTRPNILWKRSNIPRVSLLAADARHYLKKRQLLSDHFSHAVTQ